MTGVLLRDAHREGARQQLVEEEEAEVLLAALRLQAARDALLQEL